MRTHAHIQIHTFWQSGAERHAHQSSPCLSSRAPLQGADVWGQLTASANFCVQSKQQHSALLAAMGNVLLKWGEGWPLSHCKVSWGWVERGKKSEKEGTRRGETVSRSQVACIGKSPQFHALLCVEAVQGSILAGILSTPVWHHQENQATYLIVSTWPLQCSSVCSLVWIALWKVADKHKMEGKRGETM